MGSEMVVDESGAMTDWLYELAHLEQEAIPWNDGYLDVPWTQRKSSAIVAKPGKNQRK